MDWNHRTKSRQRGGAMAGFLIVVVVFILILGGIFLWYKNNYNRAVRLDENVRNAWAQVETQLQRRYDLIPNLVSTVKGIAKQEQDIFLEIQKYRAQYFSGKTAGEKVQAANQLEALMPRMLLLVEKYPELKSNQNFLKLQDELAGTENRVAVERKRYNDAVTALKTFAREFFGSYFAEKANVKADEVEHFKAAEEAQGAPPKVEF